VGSLGERPLDRRGVAALPFERPVGGHVVPQRLGARPDRVLVDHDRRQRLVVDLDQGDGILRLVDGLGDHEGDRLAEIAHAIDRQHRLRAVGGGAAVELAEVVWRQVRQRRDRTDTLLRQFGRRQHQQHARRPPGFLSVDPGDPGMGIGRTQHGGEGLPWQPQVVAVPALPRQEPTVLDPLDPRPDQSRIHGIGSRSARCRSLATRPRGRMQSGWCRSLRRSRATGCRDLYDEILRV
jgi:hypothetical protein